MNTLVTLTGNHGAAEFSILVASHLVEPTAACGCSFRLVVHFDLRWWITNRSRRTSG